MLSKIFTHRVARFVVVGFCNAAISFGILNLAFYTFDQTKIMASIISTTCALIFSFVLNRNFVFGDKTRKAHKQLPAFVIVTVSGSLIVLNLVYILSLHLLDGHETFIIDAVHSLTAITLTKSFVEINISTVLGAIAALFWNYNGYRWFVFKGHKNDGDEEIQLTV